MGIHPFVRQNKLGSCLHRLALSERVRGGLILIVRSQLIVDVAQFLVLNWRSESCRLWQRLFHHVFAVQKDEVSSLSIVHSNYVLILGHI